MYIFKIWVADDMTEFINLIDDYLVTDIVEEIYEENGYKSMLESSNKIEDKTRIEIESICSINSTFPRRESC